MPDNLVAHEMLEGEQIEEIEAEVNEARSGRPSP